MPSSSSSREQILLSIRKIHFRQRFFLTYRNKLPTWDKEFKMYMQEKKNSYTAYSDNARIMATQGMQYAVPPDTYLWPAVNSTR